MELAANACANPIPGAGRKGDVLRGEGKGIAGLRKQLEVAPAFGAGFEVGSEFGRLLPIQKGEREIGQ